LPTAIDSQLTIVDQDDLQLQQAIVQIASGFVSGEDVLEFDPQSGINATFDASTGTLTATGDVDLEGYQQLLRSVRFASSATTTSDGLRDIRFSVSDGVDAGSADFDLTIQTN